jgi:thiamine biosynthesis lipoprotein
LHKHAKDYCNHISHLEDLIKALKIFFVYLIFFFCVGCGPQEVKLIKETRFLMGTLFDITVLHTDVDKARKGIDKAFDEIQRIEGFTSKYILKSEIARINQNAGKSTFTASSELYSLLRKSIQYSEFTEGAFDVTIGTVQNLWNFENEKGTAPSPQTLLPLLPLVNYKNILLEKNFVKLKHKGMKLDLGAVAKGYAIDKGIEILKKYDINNAILNGGGDLKSIGEKSSGVPWKIGIRHPRKPASIIASLNGKNNAMATSGDYQKYFIQNGIRYHHILNPATGMQAQGLQSVTIIAKEAVLADAMATAVFVMGAERGMKFIEEQNRLEGVLITAEGKNLISSGIDNGEIDIHDDN